MNNNQERIDQIFEKVESQLSELLKLQQFTVHEQKIDHEAFGSRYIIWINDQDKEAIRFLWDGKERWFVLEESPVAENLKTWSWPWADILLLQINNTTL